MNVITGTVLPDHPSVDAIYVLTPKAFDPEFYRERTDRNIGWITREEQELLRSKTIGISGCGGMGGLIAQTLLRMGIGTIKIADTEQFDVSNINRQFAAARGTVGVSKAFATAEALRNISDDTTIVIYPRGINERDVDHFLDGCDLVLDEIEFWAVAARILLHQRGRTKNIPLMNCNTIGFGTRLFLFTPTGTTMEQCLELDYASAKTYEEKLAAGTLTHAERIRVMGAVMLGLLPELPAYCPPSEPCGHPAAARKRLAAEGKAPIIATNPPMASGFMADHIVLHLLKHSGIKRHVVYPPEPPGYLYFDAALMKAKVQRGTWLFRMKHRLKIKMLERAAQRAG